MIDGDKLRENKKPMTTIKLEAAQRFLGPGGANARQAIIPMDGTKAGDPHDLPKSWNIWFFPHGKSHVESHMGSMWWYNEEDIKIMQDFCEKEPIPSINK